MVDKLGAEVKHQAAHHQDHHWNNKISILVKIIQFRVDKPAQKRADRRISVESSAGRMRERVSMARERRRRRGNATYLVSSCRGAKGLSQVIPSSG